MTTSDASVAEATPAKSAPPARPPATKKASPGKASQVAPAVAKKATASKAEPAIEAKAKKPKLVRDSFTIPKDEYEALAALKQRAGVLSHPTKKSELLRAGLKLLTQLDNPAFLVALQAIPALKTGRPKAEAEGKASAKASSKKAKA